MVDIAAAPTTWSGPWTLPASGTFTWTQQPAATTATISGAISGAANFTKSGAGTTLLTGPNTYTGITTVANGILNVNSMNSVTGGSASSALGHPTTAANGTINLGATTTGVTLTYSGVGETSDRVINLAGTTGGATIEQDGSGALFLSTNFTATGVGVKTLTLQGSNTGTNAIGGAIVNSTSATSLTKAQAGSWTLLGTNTFTGNITISAGTLTIGGNGKLGSGSYAGTIANSGTFNYASSVSQALSGIISSTGSLVDSGSGTLTVSAANTYSGSTTINSGSTLTVGGAGKLANTTITLNGTLNFNSSTSFTLTNAISGSGSMNQGGSATTTLIGANTGFTGPITITGGLLAFNNDGNLGAVPSSFTNEFTLNGGPNSGLRAASSNPLNVNRGITLGANGGEIQVAQNDTGTYNSVISGSGPFQDGQNSSTGLGVLVLTGVYTYTNTTTIACGTLRLGAAGSIASSSGIIMSNATFFDVSSNSSYSLGSSAFTGIGGAATTTTIIGAVGGTVDFGSQPITLSFVPSLATGDPTNAALTISQSTLVLNGNTFNVTNASALNLGIGNYTLIQQSSGNVNATGPFNLNLFGTALAANTSASVAVINGSVVLQVLPTGGNTSAYFTNLTASQSASYGTATATVSGTVVGPGPVYPTNGATVSVTVAGVTTNATINDNAGDFSLTAAINIIPAGNYVITYSSAADATVPISAATDTSTLLTITKAPLTVTATAQSKTYGAVIPTGAGNANFTSTGLQNGEIIGSVTLAVSGNGATATGTVAGSPYTITPSAATGGTFNANNYSITYATNSLTVNPGPLSVTANAQSKTYGQNVNFGSGSTAFTSAGLSNSETIGSVTLALSGSGGATNAPVSGSPYTITPSVATGGTFTAGNYAITYNTNLLTVNPATLTVTANNTSIPYGSTNATLTATFTNFVDGETLGTSDVGGSPALTTVDLSTNDPIGAYPITNSIGTLTSTNYTFSLVNGTLTITPLAVNISGTRPYDGTNDADSSILTIANDLDGANLTLSGSALLAGSAAGAEPISDFTALSLGGTAATNYTLTGAIGSVNVTTLPLTITANAQTNTYGSTLNLGTSAFSVGAGLVSPETVTAVVLSANGGTNGTDPVSGSPYIITPSAATGANGFLAANYSITYSTNSLTLNPLVAVLAGTRPYDGTTAAASGILSVANVVGSDDVIVASGSGTLASAAVGTNAIASVGTLALGGTTAPNYTLSGASGSVIVTNPHTPFTITSSAFDHVGTNIVIIYQSVPGVVYQVLSSPNAAAALNTWTNEGSAVTATDVFTTNVIPASTSGTKVYIVKDVQ